MKYYKILGQDQKLHGICRTESEDGHMVRILNTYTLAWGDYGGVAISKRSLIEWGWTLQAMTEEAAFLELI